MRGPMIPKDNTYANLLAPEDLDRLAACRPVARAAHSGVVDGFGALASLDLR